MSDGSKSEVEVAITVKGGWLDGMSIRRARKPAHCNNYLHCSCQDIHPGDYYTEMGVDPDVACGFGMKSCAWHVPAKRPVHH